MLRNVFLLLVLCGCCGCPSVAPPRILHPGPIDYQQNRAQRFDPYPLNDVGPYIGGGRPMQYDIPAPENERVQNDINFEERYGRPAPTGMYRAPRSTPSTPLVIPATIAPSFTQ